MSAVDSARHFFQTGVGQFRAGNFLAAESSFRQALELAPPRASVLTNLANALLAQGKAADAAGFAERSVRLDRAGAKGWFVLGQCLSELGRHEEALASYQQSVWLEPSNPSVWLNLGATLCFLDRHPEGVACFDTVLRLQPDHVNAWLNRGLARLALGEPDAAIADYDQGLALDPSNAELWFNRGIVLNETGRSEEAIGCYDRALQVDPRYAQAWNNRGVALKALGHLTEALAGHDRAVEFKPDYVEAWTNRGWLLCELKRYDESLACYEQALRIDPGHADAHWNESLARLLLGQFEAGWRKYSYRWKIHKAKVPRLTSDPLIRLEDAAPGRRILLWAEQGYGDTLQFCRFAPLLAQRGAQVFVEAQPPLKELLGTLGVDGVFAHGDPLPPFDLQAALLDLPGIFGTGVDSVPAAVPYLRADTQLAAQWEARLPAREGSPRVGICCSGNPQHANDAQRSMPLSAFAPLCGRAQLFLIQKDLRAADADFARAHPQIIFLGDQITTFSDSAAIVAEMDLVISVDTSLAHLAGALGTPVWILLPWAPEWRWMLDRSDCPWYPSATLFRQQQRGEWDDVIRRVATALDDLAAGRRP